MFLEISEITKQYWVEEDWKDLKNTETASGLYIIAKRIIERMPKPFVQVCGPIGTGGLGSIKANLNVFNNTIKELQNQGLCVFDQMPFEESMQKLHEKSTTNDEYPESILTDFYCPIFESRLISTFYFLPNWKTTTGSKWEHKKAKEFGAKIVYLES